MNIQTLGVSKNPPKMIKPKASNPLTRGNLVKENQKNRLTCNATASLVLCCYCHLGNYTTENYRCDLTLQNGIKSPRLCLTSKCSNTDYTTDSSRNCQRFGTHSVHIFQEAHQNNTLKLRSRSTRKSTHKSRSALIREFCKITSQV